MFFRDIARLNNFLEIFNGQVKFYEQVQNHTQVWVAASLLQVVAKYDNCVYSCDIPQEIKDVAFIVHFEAANIFAAIRIWFKESQDATTIVLYCVAFNIKLVAEHIKGIHNTFADILSRWNYFQAKKIT